MCEPPGAGTRNQLGLSPVGIEPPTLGMAIAVRVGEMKATMLTRCKCSCSLLACARVYITYIASSENANALPSELPSGVLSNFTLNLQ